MQLGTQGRTIKRFAATFALLVLISLAGIWPLTHARKADIGMAPYPVADKFLGHSVGEPYTPDHPEKVIAEISVDNRFVRAGVEAPEVRVEEPAAEASDELLAARSILDDRIATYPILVGATVEFGDTQGNPQAIVYYRSARIVINPNHTRSLEEIIDHEIWHIIDWRDNGRIDWYEDVPPANAADYR